MLCMKKHQAHRDRDAPSTSESTTDFEDDIPLASLHTAILVEDDIPFAQLLAAPWRIQAMMQMTIFHLLT